MAYKETHFTSSVAVKEDTEVLVMDETDTGNKSELIVYNDEHNTFDWVIKCFVEIIGHTEAQAEQLSLIIHYKGKATVKVGTLQTLRPLRQALVDRGLSAVIEEIGEAA